MPPQDIEPPFKVYERIESFRVQDYPQLNNSYKEGEVVCALYPNVEGREVLTTDSTHWLTEFYPAIVLKLMPPSRPTKALLKFENDAHTLDHHEPMLERVVPLSVIVKREKVRGRGDGDAEEELQAAERTEIDIVDPLYPDLGLRQFLWDSMTEYWHDSHQTSRKIRFKCHMAVSGARPPLPRPTPPSSSEYLDSLSTRVSLSSCSEQSHTPLCISSSHHLINPLAGIAGMACMPRVLSALTSDL